MAGLSSKLTTKFVGEIMESVTIADGKIKVVNKWGDMFEGRITKTGRVISKNKRHWYVLYLAYQNYKKEC